MRDRLASHVRVGVWLRVLLLLGSVAAAAPDVGAAEQASQPGATAAAQLDAGRTHTCALLAGGHVRCWGYGGDGELGYGNEASIGATQTPASVGPVELGAGRTATTISAGGYHTCAILDDGSVLCWGFGGNGRLGYGNTNNVGDTQTPGSVGPVDLGGHTATAISAGLAHTCAILDDGSVRCWGFNYDGQLGYGNTDNVGDGKTNLAGMADKTPASVGPVDLGAGRTAIAISAGDLHTCAILDDGSVRCWGYGGNGQLGYANTKNVGDTHTPASTGPVDLGPGRTAIAISAGGAHTCARLDDGHVRCWGYGGNGRLGYCNENNVGDTQPPAAAGPVSLQPGDGGIGCVATSSPPGSQNGAALARALRFEALRAHRLRNCLAGATGQPKPKQSRRRHACLRRYGRTPGGVTGLRARAISKTRIALSFDAPGTDGPNPPAATTYLVKQSPRPLHGPRDFALAQTLCHGTCRFQVTQIGTKITLTITNLKPNTTYYYTIAARDNISGRLGAHSPGVKATTR
jgi:hypothetical protein